MNRASLAPFVLGLVVGAVAASAGIRLAGGGRTAPSDEPANVAVERPVPSPVPAPPVANLPPPAPVRPAASSVDAGPRAEPSAPVPAAVRAPAPALSATAPAAASDLKSGIRAALDSHDNRRAQDLILKLIQSGPEGRTEALAFLTEIAKASGGGRGRNSNLWRVLSEPEALPVILDGLEKPDLDPALKSRMVWAMDHHEEPEATRFLVRKVGEEQDPRTLSAYVEALSNREEPAVRDALSSLALSPVRPPDVRRQALGALADFGDPSVDAVLARAAQYDPDTRVRAQASVAMVERHPPAAGILIQSVTPNTQAQAVGLLPGDIIVEYNGKPYADMGEFRGALQGAPAETQVPIRVHRGGQLLTLQVRSGFLGINGQSVTPR